MKIEIDRAGYHQRHLIMKIVEHLLKELGEKDIDKERVSRNLWENQERVHPFLAKDESGRVIGLMIVVETFAIHAGGCYGVMDEVYVEPEFRGLGVGKKMMEAAKELGKRRNWQRLETTPSGSEQQRIIHFYEREGFQQTGPKLRFLL